MLSHFSRSNLNHFKFKTCFTAQNVHYAVWSPWLTWCFMAFLMLCFADYCQRRGEMLTIPEESLAPYSYCILKETLLLSSKWLQLPHSLKSDLFSLWKDRLHSLECSINTAPSAFFQRLSFPCYVTVLVCFLLLWQRPRSKPSWRGKASCGLHFLITDHHWEARTELKQRPQSSAAY